MTSKYPRPTSPHLQIYKLPLTGLISITHRITGVLLSVGLLFIVAFFYVIAQGEGAYNTLQLLTASWLAQLFFWGFIFALFFHACHGVRHLLWDMGSSFEPDKLTQYGAYELLAALGLTLATVMIM